MLQFGEQSSALLLVALTALNCCYSALNCEVCIERSDLANRWDRKDDMVATQLIVSSYIIDCQCKNI